MIRNTNRLRSGEATAVSEWGGVLELRNADFRGPAGGYGSDDWLSLTATVGTISVTLHLLSPLICLRLR